MATPPRALAAVAAATAVMALLALPGPASAEREFGARFSTNIQGDVTGAGNTLLSCSPADDDLCAAARAGNAGGSPNSSANNNNERPMTYVDVDDDPATFNSSAATLVLPAGARVVQAALYFGGRDQAGTGGRPPPTPSARDRALIKTPGSDAYVPVIAALVDDAGSPPANPRRLYAGVADATTLIKAGGAGEYTVANVQLGTGKNADQSGGWALEVFYEDPSQPSRNVTVFDGFQFVTSTGEGGVPITLKLDGFLTPRSGPVRSRVGLVAFEGDLGLTGDSALLNGRKLTNSTNPEDNYFNSSLSTRTGTFTAKRPNYLNQLGFDGDVLGADGYLGNNQTSTTVVLQTVGDGYAPAAVSIATDLFAPSITPTKRVDKATARLGDELVYEIGLTNSGLDAATNVTLVDPIPAGTTYVKGSLQILGGDGPPGRTDRPNDDEAEYVAAQRAVVFRLGDGATDEVGGRLAVNASASVRFKVTVNDRLADATRIVNYGTASFRSETLDQPGSVRTPDAVTVVRVPDLTIQKTRDGDFETGETTPFTLVVSNVGGAATDGRVTVTDELPDELDFVGRPGGDGWDCDTAGRELTCKRDDALAPGDAWPAIRFVALVDEDATPGEIANTGKVRGGGETNTSNNESTVTGPLPEPRIDLAIDKRAESARFFPGERVRFRLAITNLGPSRATGVRVRDVLPPGLELISLGTSQGTCEGTSCTIGVLRRGQVETVRVVAVAGLDTGGRSLRDVAVITGDQPDVNPRNNIDSAVVRILSLVDLVVTKVAAAPSMPAGSDVQFTVTVRNAGPSTARRVVFRDVVPAGLELVSLAPSQGTCAPPNCALGRMERDDVAQILVTARSRPDQAGQTFVNTAAALPLGQLERTPADNIARASVTLTAAPVPQSDIVVSKTVETTTAVVGEPLRYRLKVANKGPDAASAVIVTESPGGRVSVVSAEPSQGTCAVGQPIRCDLGPLAVGATATIEVTTVPLEPGPLDNAVTAIGPGTDPGPDDNDDEATVDVESVPELSLTKRASRRVVLGGRLVTFTLVVRASGDSPAHETVLCDRVPAGLAVVREGRARLRGNRACWVIGTLDPGESRRFRLVTRAEPVRRVTRVTNTAAVTADGIAALTARARVRILPLPALPCPPAAARGARSAARC